MSLQATPIHSARLFSFPAVLAALAFFSLPPGTPCRADSWNEEVTQYGKMREVLGEGRHQGRVRLGDVTDRPHCYAVGAVAQLAGEVTILDGEIVVTGVDDSGQPATSATGAQLQEAAMLVTAYVPRWTQRRIEDDVSADDLERFLLDAARRAGLDPSKPFPFVIEGNLAGLEIHVINGACPMRAKRLGQKLPADRQPHRNSFRRTNGLIVGIYAAGEEHRLTHHGTQTHMHVLLKDKKGRQYTGHIERVGLRTGTLLRLPAQ